jgi:hypothetical protein
LNDAALSSIDAAFCPIDDAFYINAEDLGKNHCRECIKDADKPSIHPMTDPLTVAAIATLVCSKGFEEIGKTLGAKTLEQGGKLARLLRGKLSPQAATAIAHPDQPEAHQQAIVEVEEIAKTDPEISQAIQVVAEAIQAQPQGVQTFNNWIGKAVSVNQAQIINNNYNLGDF